MRKCAVLFTASAGARGRKLRGEQPVPPFHLNIRQNIPGSPERALLR